MLFNSYGFILLFLPVTLLGFFLACRMAGSRVAIFWLVCASLFFYGWWNPVYLLLIIGSIICNYAIGVGLLSFSNPGQKKLLLVFGSVANLAVLAYFKYTNFIVDNINLGTDSNFQVDNIVLPLALSFFTFQQIAYLVDTARGLTREHDFLHYCLFVTFFPQLIAGPIVHHREMLPQFARQSLYRFRSSNLAIGLTIFAIGLFKKTVIADGIAIYATPVFSAADTGIVLSFADAWGGTLAYAFQLYFDFSGYSDMAIGLARMFGIRLPLNFNSPYKATSIIDFWRRWHITLSRFLRDYLYISLGGNRKGDYRRYTNLFITMLLGGLWHGAGWNFLLWGGLHGLYLIVNHFWRTLSDRHAIKLGVYWGWALTFLATTIAWVPFRAETIEGCLSIWRSMFGIDTPGQVDSMFFVKPGHWMALVLVLLIAVALPNVQQLMRRYKPAFETYYGEVEKHRWQLMEWRPTILWASLSGAIFVGSLYYLSRPSEFLYFQF